MSVLLRQPHGFEGFGTFVEDLHPDSLVIAKRPNMRYPGVVFHPTTSTTCPRTDEDHNPAVGVSTNLSISQLSSSNASSRLRSTSMTAARPRKTPAVSNDPERLVHLEVGGEEIDVVLARPVEPLVACIKSLHVLRDIVRAVSRRLRSRRERLAPTGPRLRGLAPG